MKTVALLVLMLVRFAILRLSWNTTLYDIIPAGDEGNPGHAKIIMIPQRCVSKNKRKDEFDSLREFLAEIATDNVNENDWTLKPTK